MGTKNISLPGELEAYIDAKVASGEYAHASEVVRDGVRLLMQEEARKLEWLREAIAKGEADIAAGRVLTSKQVRKALRGRATELRKPYGDRT
ncbi:MAG TPA: type II toxin-antitoxin system ParD family antitoxin [Candidatus Nitrosotalea sp.]|nr:type II toxin-antitoxin system ParD family antitoxin [Candidatus Nitrosotalea sp.]